MCVSQRAVFSHGVSQEGLCVQSTRKLDFLCIMTKWQQQFHSRSRLIQEPQCPPSGCGRVKEQLILSKMTSVTKWHLETKELGAHPWTPLTLKCLWKCHMCAVIYELFTGSLFLKDPQDEDQVSHRSSSSRLSKSPLKGVKKVKIMQCKVTLLDNTDYTIDVEVRKLA